MWPAPGPSGCALLQKTKIRLQTRPPPFLSQHFAQLEVEGTPGGNPLLTTKLSNIWWGAVSGHPPAAL